MKEQTVRLGPREQQIVELLLQGYHCARRRVKRSGCWGRDEQRPSELIAKALLL